MKIFAKTFVGLEDVLIQELKNYNVSDIQKITRAVSFSTDKATLYKLCYTLRTAVRLLLPLEDFIFDNVEDFYQKIKQIEFEKYFDHSKTISIDAIVRSAFFTNSHYVELKAKDAIVDRFREITGNRPSVDTKKPQIIINIYINSNSCNVSLDYTGQPLFKRGYRTSTGEAPLNEVLAAGIIQLTRWDKQTRFVDFMCGSGTLPIEAAMYAYNIPAQLLRKDFAFFHFIDFEKDLWLQIVEQEKNKITDNFVEIWASDISPRAIDNATENIANLRLLSLINLKKIDFRHTSSSKKCHIVVNPPYWKRLEGQNAQTAFEFYRQIGDTLKNNYKGSTAWIFSGNIKALKQIGLKHSEKINLFNGAIDSRLVKYKIH